MVRLRERERQRDVQLLLLASTLNSTVAEFSFSVLYFQKKDDIESHPILPHHQIWLSCGTKGKISLLETIYVLLILSLPPSPLSACLSAPDHLGACVCACMRERMWFTSVCMHMHTHTKKKLRIHWQNHREKWFLFKAVILFKLYFCICIKFWLELSWSIILLTVRAQTPCDISPKGIRLGEATLLWRLQNVLPLSGLYYLMSVLQK